MQPLVWEIQLLMSINSKPHKVIKAPQELLSHMNETRFIENCTFIVFHHQRLNEFLEGKLFQFY